MTHKKLSLVTSFTLALLLQSFPISAKSSHCKEYKEAKGQVEDSGFAKLPENKVPTKVEYECKSAGNDSEVFRLTLYKSGTGEIVYASRRDKYPSICSLTWKKDGENFAIDLKGQDHIKLFFTNAEENKKLISDGVFKFNSGSEFWVSATTCLK